MVIYFVDLGLLAVAYFVLFLFGGSVLCEVANFLLGPIRYLIFALFIALMIIIVKKCYLESSSGNKFSKFLGSILTTCGCIMRHGVALVLSFYFLFEFTEEFNDGLVGMIGGTLGFIIGFFFMGMLLCGIFLIDAELGTLQIRRSPILVGIINVIISFIAMIIIQAIFLQGVDIDGVNIDNPVLYNALTGTWFCESDFANWILETFF